MAAQKRGRAGYGGRRRQKPRRSQHQQKQQEQQQEEQQQQEPPSQTPSDEESTDSGSVTRCICQESHNVGLMVQCDQCEVWQHCECMGLGEQDIPEHYYCEQCKPENHAPKKVTRGRRSYNSSSTTVLDGDKRVTKKRMTFNSREASMSLEDVLAARSALEFPLDRIESESPPDSPKEEATSESEKKEEEKATSAQDSNNSNSNNNNNNNSNSNSNSDRDTAAKDEKGSDSEMPDLKHEQGSVTQTMHGTSPDTPSSLPASDERPATATTTSTATAAAKPKRPAATRSRSDDSNRATKEPKRPKPASRRSATSARRAATAAKSRSRTSTPQPSSQAGDETPIEPEISTSIFDKLSQCARESSPPAKVRYPSARMTISEMNKRAKQILEYISSIQVEMATTTAGNGSPQVQKMNIADGTAPLTDTSTKESSRRGRKPGAIMIPDKSEKGPSSSLSSASTIPLEEPLTAEDGPDENTEALYREKSVAQETLDQMNETTGESSSSDNTRSKKEQTSMEIMDMLTGELIRFQRRFGSIRPRHHDAAEDESMSGSEEPTAQDDPFPPEQPVAHV